ncbi:DotI/IcmL family type IV secretion protein [Acinetobacter sp. YH12153]|uniref:DotI/IcmL family type IV secretion protein n=1 Tax=Acinetobacter sp. YH12153 TaxID=2601133 RepID=UPI0015D32BF1|nr:DotI/IcmL family type IV secretion protein [Acinetobacter sp. YH12153]
MSINNDSNENPLNHAEQALNNEIELAEQAQAEANEIENDDQIVDEGTQEPLSYEEALEQLSDLEKQLFGAASPAILTVHKENLRVEQNLYQSRKTVRLSMVIAAASLIGNIVLLSAFFQYPKYKTVQTIDNSVICELNPDTNPEFSHVALEDFAKNSVLAAYSFDYVNYADMLHTATSKYFTEEGKELFNRALNNSGFVNHILANKLSIKAVVLSAPKLENQGRDKYNNLYWIVRVPVKIDFYAGSAMPKASERYIAQIRLVQTKRNAFNPRGVGVKTLTLHPVD